MLNPLLMDWTPEEQNRVFGYNQTWLNIHELRHAGPDTDYTDEKVDLKLYLGTVQTLAWVREGRTIYMPMSTEGPGMPTARLQTGFPV